MKLNAVTYRDESGVYCAEIPALPGCVSDGDTFEEAQENIREAAEGWENVGNAAPRKTFTLRR